MMALAYWSMLFLVSVVVGSQAVPSGGGDSRCEAKHKDLLEEAVSIRRECGEMEVHDCCAGTMMSLLHRDYYHSSIYQVQSSCESFRNPFQSSRNQLARCDMTTDNGGWMVVFRRDTSVTTRVSFDRDWVDYETGFGDLETEFWYGLREMHCLTQTDVDMRIDMTATNGTKFSWTYSLFKIDGPDTNYRLRIGGPVGSPGTYSVDAITSHVKPGGTPFSTRDRDNDGNGGNCATGSNFSGGWWWYNCGYALLTRLPPNAMRWGAPGHAYINLSFVEMKIRPKSCSTTLQSCS